MSETSSNRWNLSVISDFSGLANQVATSGHFALRPTLHAPRSPGSAPLAARRAGYPWTEQMSRKKSRKVRETRSSYSRKRPELGQKCRQRLELGIHGLKSWGCNWSRKVREMRSSSLCSAHPARITRCKFLQLLRYLCQFMYLTTVKLVLRNSFDLNYLRKMCGTWVRWFPDILFQSIQADSHLIDRRRDESSLSGRLAMAANHILSISELPGPLIFAANPVH
jgi:hypothetical protein